MGFRGLPKFLFGQKVFGRPGVPRPKNHKLSGNEWFVGLAAEGGKAKKTLVSGKGVGLWPWYPRPPKKHLANKNTSGCL